MFPIDKRIAQMVWYPAPDVIPQLCHALDDVPMDVWNAHTGLHELADAIEPWLKKHGGRKWDFIWSMERHFSEPYGPLPKARESFMAGIPDLFLPQESGAPEVAAAGGPARTGVLAEQAHLNRVRQGDVEVLASPCQYEADSQMPAEYREWLEKMFFVHGECMLPVFGEAAIGKRTLFFSVDEHMIAVAPDGESRLRVNNFTSEEFKHQYQFYHVYREFDPQIPMRIYEREQAVYRAYQAIQPEKDFVDRSLFHMLADRFGVYQGFEWVQSSYAPLARVSLKVVKDERGHSNYGYLHVRDALEKGGGAIRAALQARVDDYFYPSFMASFGGSKSRNNTMWRKWGLKQHTNDQLRAAYHAEMALVLDSLGMRAPDMQTSLALGLEQAAGRAAARAAETSPA